jgi:hypothetical protein
VLMGRVLEVAVSGYYAWQPRQRAQADERVGLVIQHAFTQGRHV